MTDDPRAPLGSPAPAPRPARVRRAHLSTVPAPPAAPPAATRGDRVALGLLAAGWTAFFLRTDQLRGGYHLVDDHELIRLVSELRTASFTRVAWTWMVRDLSWRFRPLYYLHRVTEALVFGDRFVAWSAYLAITALVTTGLLYLALRRWRFPPLAALAFVFFTAMGEQAANWWRLGPSEPLGLLWFAAALLGAAHWSASGKMRWRALLWGGALLASLSKECFVILLPALGAGLVWAVHATRTVPFRRAVRICLTDLAFLGAVLAVELFAILAFVGTERTGYAGVQGIGPGAVLTAAVRLLGGPEVTSLAALAIAGALLRWRAGAWRALTRAWPGAVVVLAVVGSQAVLYAKSGIMEHYLLPGALGFALAAALGVRWVMAAPRAHQRAARRAAPAIALALLLPLAIPRAATAVRDGRRFAAEGRATTAFLEALSRAPGPLLVAGGVSGIAEQFWSVRWWLRLEGGREDVRFLFAPGTAPLTPFERQLLAAFTVSDLLPGYTRAVDGLPGAVGVLPFAGPLEPAAPWLAAEGYRQSLSAGDFAVYTRP